MRKFSFILISIFFLLFPSRISAIYDPLSVPNNKYGIHIADFNDVSKVNTLINSTGGDWGYVTLVMQDSQKHTDLWQDIFNQMRRLHIVPIVRLATNIQGDRWSVPQKNDAEDWARFLNSLNWPTENRYVILFNEPNHANEWGGEVNPEKYTEVFTEFANKLKGKNENFFVLPAALDVSAPNSSNTMDAVLFWQRMVSANKAVFSLIDGWNTHSYPNPGFSGSPNAKGRGTLASYKWEIDTLKNLGLTKKLPIFISETGWKHQGGKNLEADLLHPFTVAFNITTASETVWKDPHIAAITPFVFSYQDSPFDHFSWRTIGSEEYYPFYTAYKNITKVNGEPKQLFSFKTLSPLFPKSLVSLSAYNLGITIRNTGESIIDPGESYSLDFTSDNSGIVFSNLVVPVLEPGQAGQIRYHLNTPSQIGISHLKITLKNNNHSIEVGNNNLLVIPPPSLRVTAPVAWKDNPTFHAVTLLIYDMNDQLIHKFINLKMTNGAVHADRLNGIIPGNAYRIVLLIPGYLPRQSTSILIARKSDVKMKRMLPLDLNRDGAFTTADLKALFGYTPKQLMHLVM